MTAFNQLEQRASSFQKKMANVEQFSRLNSKLKEAGMYLGKQGQIYAKNRQGAISQAEAMMRITEESKRQAKIASDRKAFIAMPEGLEDMSRFSKMGEQLGGYSRQGMKVNKQLDEMRTRLKGNKEALNAFNQGVVRGRQYFNMFNLSLMFGGMALQRVGMMMFRFMIPSMDKLEKLNTQGAKKVMGMSAAFEFLKISLFETLSQTSLFKAFVEGFIKLAVWVGEFAQKHPMIASIVASLAGLATVLGTGGIILGGLGNIATMFTGAWAVIKKWIGTDGTGGKIGTSLTGYQNFIKGFGAAVAIAYVVKVGWDLLTNESDAKDRINAIFKGALGGAIAGALIGSMFGGVGAVPGAIIGAISGTILMTVAAVVDYFIEDKPQLSDLQNVLNDMFGNWKSILKTGTLNLVSGGLYVPIKILFGTMAETDKRIEGEESLSKMKADAEKVLSQSNILGLGGAVGGVDIGLLKAGNRDKQIEVLTRLIGKEKELTGVENASQRIEMAENIERQRQALQELIPNYYTIESQVRSAIDLANQKTQKIKEEKLATDELQNNIVDKSPEIIQAYADQYSEMMTSDEGFKELKKRMTEFGTTVSDTMGKSGEKDSSGVIGKFFAFGKEIKLDEVYFVDLRNKVEDWASKVTKKTVEITYVHKNSGSDNGSGNEDFFGKIGRAVDTLIEQVGSITGPAGGG
jgi:hypothetical protein